MYENLYKKILGLVMDNDDTAKGAFSIYNITKMGFVNNKLPGDWYGPQAISLLLKVLSTLLTKILGFEQVI